MKRTSVLAALLVAVTGLIAGQATAAPTAPVAADRLQALEQGILTRLNATRVSRGLKPLRISADLRAAALFHSRSMLEHGFFEHESRDGSPFSVRVKRFYGATGYDRWSAGENLLYSTGEMDAATAITAWLNSPAHRENMLAPGWREVGLGALYKDAAGGTFGGESTWVITMDFGSRAGGPARTVASASAVMTPKPTAAKSAKKPRTATIKSHKRAAARPDHRSGKAAKPVKRPGTQKVERVLPKPTNDDAMLDETTADDEVVVEADEFDFTFDFELDELGIDPGDTGVDEDGAAGGDADPPLQA